MDIPNPKQSDSFTFNHPTVDNEEKTEILYGPEIIFKKTFESENSAKYRLEGCIDHKSIAMHVINEPVWNALTTLKEKGVKIKVVSEVTSDNITFCKKFMEVVELRHVSGLKSNFAIADGKVYLGHVISPNGYGILDHAILSTAKSMVDSQQYIFNTLWNEAIPASTKILEIEKGVKPNVIETLVDPIRIQNRFVTLIESAKKEIMIIFPNTNTLKFYHDNGILQRIKDRLDNNTDLQKVSILTPFFSDEKLNELIIDTLKGNEQQSDVFSNIDDRNVSDQDNDKENNSCNKNNAIYLKEIVETSSSIKSIVLVVDKRESLVIEINYKAGNYDDADIDTGGYMDKTDIIYQDNTSSNKDIINNISNQLSFTNREFYDSIGFATYSNSRSTVLSYVSIFESLSKETEILEQVKIHDRIQKEFINTAAHELRSPIQPILGLSDSLLSIKRQKISMDSKDEIQFLESILRNAKRLKILTENVLDITKIDSNTFELHKENFDLNESLMVTIADFKSRLNYNNNNNKVEIKYDFNRSLFPENKIKDNSLIILADKHRIIQVISNLLDNAIKFTKEGIILVTVSFKPKDDESKKDSIIINVKDSGEGINKDIMPRLFSKFATKSFQGTGLGLFISKNIIEAHGGKIWAENNNNNKDDGKGAIFSFIIPIDNDNKKE